MHALHLLLSTWREVSTETRNWNTFRLRRCTHREKNNQTRNESGGGKGTRNDEKNGGTDGTKWVNDFS